MATLFSVIQQHPIIMAHHDQLLRFLVADAKQPVACLKTAWFAYDYSNWSGANTFQVLADYYCKAGFDARMIYVHYVIEGLEGVLFQSKLDEIAGRLSTCDAINLWWRSWLSAFNALIEEQRQAMDPSIWQAIEPLFSYLNIHGQTVQADHVLMLLCDYLRQIYSTDYGLQAFWLNQAKTSLSRNLVA
jgi:hypothetical protein